MFENLLPLDVSHVNTLRRFHSPFLTGQKPNVADLAFAVIICTRSLDDFLALGTSGKMPDLFVEMRHYFATGDVDRAVAEFQKHLDAGVSVASVVASLDESNGPAPAPWLLPGGATDRD